MPLLYQGNRKKFFGRKETIFKVIDQKTRPRGCFSKLFLLGKETIGGDALLGTNLRKKENKKVHLSTKNGKSLKGKLIRERNGKKIIDTVFDLEPYSNKEKENDEVRSREVRGFTGKVPGGGRNPFLAIGINFSIDQKKRQICKRIKRVYC